MELRALRGPARRRAWPGQYRRDRAGARPRRQVPSAAPAHAREYRRLYRLRPPAADAVRNDRDGGRRLRHSGGVCQHRRGIVEHQSDGPLSRRRPGSRKRGMLRGIGLANAIEAAGGPVPEFAEIRFNPSGSAMLLMGTKAHGQGHETAFKQILYERLGLDPDEIQYIDGDTDRVAFGMGSNGSRSMVVGGSALTLAAGKVVDKGKRLAAHLLEAAEADIEFADGRFTVVGTDRSVSQKQMVTAAFQPARLPPEMEPGFYEHATFAPQRPTFPNGCHVCEVEIDPETGAVTLLGYVVVDDVATVINPLTLQGQVHGGLAQGSGQVLMEQVVYDRQSGQLLSASFMDYPMPRADVMCGITIHENPVPTRSNPLGAKGAGEAGCVGSLPAVMIAIMNALELLGVRELDMPATSDRVWRAIRGAGGLFSRMP